MKRQNIKIFLLLALLVASHNSLTFANDDPMKIRKKPSSKIETEKDKQKDLEEIIKNSNGMVIAPNPNAAKEEVREEPQYIIHEVQKGESLSLIAKKYLGDVNRWKELIELNKVEFPSLVSNPNLIYPGWKIKVPVEKEEDKSETDNKIVDGNTENKSDVTVTDVSKESEDVEKTVYEHLSIQAKMNMLQKSIDKANRANPNRLIMNLDSETLQYMIDKGY